MANEHPEERVLKTVGVKGGALLWIDQRVKVGERATSTAFLEAFRFRRQSEHFSQDLLNELESERLVIVSPDGDLSITVNAEQWIHGALFWEQLTEALEAGST